MKPLKVEAVKLFTEVPNRGCLMNGQKDSKKESLESKLQLSLLARSTQSPNSKFSSPLPSLLFFRAPFYFAPLPTI